VTRLMTLGRSALLGWLFVVGCATISQAGLLDQFLGSATKTEKVRAQSPYRDDDCDKEIEFCGDCDHNPTPWKTRQCRKKCGATYYPAQPPYCAPCYGVYPTCWRRLDECWVCPQEKYTTKPSKFGRANVGSSGNVPPSPVATPYVPAAPAAEPVPAAPPALDPAEDTVAPPAEEASRRVSRAPVVRQASQTRPAPSRPAPARPAALKPAAAAIAAPSTNAGNAASAAPRAKSVEELLRDLQ